jgi:hypothetical protein
MEKPAIIIGCKILLKPAAPRQMLKQEMIEQKHS